MNNNLATIEEGKKRFQQILEYTTHYRGVNEAGAEENTPDEENQGGDMGGGMPPMGQDPMNAPQGDNGQGDMGGGMPPMGQDPMGGQQDNMGGGMPPMDQGNTQTPQGFNPQEPMGDMSDADFDGGVGPDDDVIDISELTDAQEDTEDAIKNVGDKFDKVLKYLGQWEEMIKSNNEKIEDLKSELEKRNPTQIEKLSMQTAKSYPFNVTPEEYWKEKEATSNYSTEDDNNGKDSGQYVITKNDVNGSVDWKTISDSLDDDAIYHPTLKNTMGYGL